MPGRAGGVLRIPARIAAHPADLAGTGIHDGLDVGDQARSAHQCKAGDTRGRKGFAQAQGSNDQGPSPADDVVNEEYVREAAAYRLHRK